MIVLTGRNVQQIFPQAIETIFKMGSRRGSRDGDVLQAPEPVTTCYTSPHERILFWPSRDANPFFHLYESLWMLCGRNDVEPLKQFVSVFDRFSDDGATLHGAYGHRWRQAFGMDQLTMIADILKKNKDDRRCVLQMWDAQLDLGKQGKDVPCNDTATFQVDTQGRLQLSVFCRSNDLIMGAYGANVVQFSVLHEFMAAWIQVPLGNYYQISVNWHAYLRDIDKVRHIPKEAYYNPYETNVVWNQPMRTYFEYDSFMPGIQELLFLYNDKSNLILTDTIESSHPWLQMAYRMLRAHKFWKLGEKQEALNSLEKSDFRGNDFVQAGMEWMMRRMREKVS
jgi:thymidylate synthase